jgi:hypothetical protein
MGQVALYLSNWLDEPRCLDDVKMFVRGLSEGKVRCVGRWVSRLKFEGGANARMPDLLGNIETQVKKRSSGVWI